MLASPMESTFLIIATKKVNGDGGLVHFEMSPTCFSMFF